jgi:hypothetical protein
MPEPTEGASKSESTGGSEACVSRSEPERRGGLMTEREDRAAVGRLSSALEARDFDIDRT